MIARTVAEIIKKLYFVILFPFFISVVVKNFLYFKRPVIKTRQVLNAPCCSYRLRHIARSNNSGGSQVFGGTKTMLLYNINNAFLLSD